MTFEEAVRLQAPLLLAVVILSLWGLATAPPDTRFPIRFGGLGHQTSLGKRTALLLWPALGFVIAMGAALGHDDGSLPWLGCAALLILLLGQAAAIRRAGR